MRIQNEVEERRGIEKEGRQGTSSFHPDHYHANILTACKAAAPLWPAWLDTLEAEERGAR